MVCKISKTGGVVALARLKLPVGRGLGGVKSVHDHKLVIKRWIQLVPISYMLLITWVRGRNEFGL